jgi:hypothetical protein
MRACASIFFKHGIFILMPLWDEVKGGRKEGRKEERRT